MKIRPVAAELFQADGQTDRHDKANSRFSQLCETRLKTCVNWLAKPRGFPLNYSLIRPAVARSEEKARRLFPPTKDDTDLFPPPVTLRGDNGEA